MIIAIHPNLLFGEHEKSMSRLSLSKLCQKTLTLCVILIPSFVNAAPFCAVTSSGADCSYYDVQSCRITAGAFGACAVNPNEGRSESQKQTHGFTDFINSDIAGKAFRDSGTWNEQNKTSRLANERAEFEIEQEKSAARTQQQQQEQQEINAQNNFDPRLMPLHPDGTLSKITASAIYTTLFVALEMNRDGKPKEWHSARGSSGFITLQKVSKNVLGEPCRSFTITMTFMNQTNATDGVACHKSGKWVWIGG